MEFLLQNGMRVTAMPSLPVTPGAVATRMNTTGKSGTVPPELVNRLNAETLRAMQLCISKFSDGHGDTPPIEQLRQLGFDIAVLGDNPPPELVSAILSFVQNLMANPQGKAADANANVDAGTVSAFHDTASGRTVRRDVLDRILSGSPEGRKVLAAQKANDTAGTVTKMSDQNAGKSGGMTATTHRALSGSLAGRATLKKLGLRPLAV